MADISVVADIKTTQPGDDTLQGGVIWTNISVGYAFYIDESDTDLLFYKKTTDKGATWGTEVQVSADSEDVETSSEWYSNWTSGITDKIIHITWMETTGDDLNYRRLDTSDDSLGTEIQIDSQTAVAFNTFARRHCTICVAEDGLVHVGGILKDNNNQPVDGGHFVSNASTPASFAQADASGVLYHPTDAGAGGSNMDFAIFCPWNDETDNSDIICLYNDVSANELSIKVFDASANSWGNEVSVSTSNFHDGFRHNQDIAYRHSDRFFWVVTVPNRGQASTDLEIFRFEDSTTPETKVDIVANDATLSTAQIIVDQNSTTDLYVAFYEGTTLFTAVEPKFKKSTDSGATWGTATTFNEAGEDDYEGLWMGTSVTTDGGRIQPIFVEVTALDMFTNLVNSVEIAVVAGRIMSSLVGAGGLAGTGGIAGKGGGLAG